MPIGRVGSSDFDFGGAFRKQSRPPAEFQRNGHSKVEIKEASDVVALPGGGFVVVGDRSDSAEYVSPGGESLRFKLDGIRNGFSGLEAVAYDPLRKNLFVASEEKQELYRYGLRFDANGVPSAALERTWNYNFKGRDNKGIEGMAFLPGALSPTGQPHVVMAKEGDPKMLVLLRDTGGTKKEGLEPIEIDLDKDIQDAVEDFSAVAVDPLTGHLFVTSDESSKILEIELSQKGDKISGKLVQKPIKLENKDGDDYERVEGATFDEKGNLYILLENSRKLYQLDRTR